MNRARTFWQSTIGKKIGMAVTGLIMVGSLIEHASGNLLVFRSSSTVTPPFQNEVSVSGDGTVIPLSRRCLPRQVVPVTDRDGVRVRTKPRHDGHGRFE